VKGKIPNVSIVNVKLKYNTRLSASRFLFTEEVVKYFLLFVYSLCKKQKIT
jgi:hypothetical protein